MIPYGSEIYFAEITGDYKYDPIKDNNNDGYPHQRDIRWLAGPISRDDLPMELRKSLRVHRTTADFSKHYDVIKALSEGRQPESVGNISSNQTIEIEYPIRLL